MSENRHEEEEEFGHVGARGIVPHELQRVEEEIN